MDQLKTHHTEHSITIGAPALNVYRLIADATTWPLIFLPCVHVEQIESSGTAERLRLWAVTNDEVKNWLSWRDLLLHERRIVFRQEQTQAPMASMRGEWIFEELPGGDTRVVLRHDFTAVDDQPKSVAWIHAALNHNSEVELTALNDVARLGHTLDELLFSFEDSMHVEGSPSDVYTFLNDANEWPRRLPHVERLQLREEPTGVQYLEMDTRGADGSAHTTASVRLCFPLERIVYKQTTVPALLTAHAGQWSLTPTASGVMVTARHGVTLAPSTFREVLGVHADVAHARQFVRDALGNNSRITLAQAKEFAEAR
jgi:aromatase